MTISLQSNKTNTKDASIIIVSYNTMDLLKECLNNTLQCINSLNIEIIVLDNSSHDQSVEMVRNNFPSVKLIQSSINLGFAAANNLAFNEAKGRYIILLNSDAFVQIDVLSKIIERMDENPNIALGGGNLVGQNGTRQASAFHFPSLTNDLFVLVGLADRYPNSWIFGKGNIYHKNGKISFPIDWVPGAFSIIRKSSLEKCGFFDERFFFYFEEVDLCKRLKSIGYEIWYWGDLQIIHVGGESAKKIKNLQFSNSGKQLTLWRKRSQLLYYRKYYGFFGAFMSNCIEVGWHSLRFVKNYLLQNNVKATESKLHIQLMLQAWKDTKGGK